MAVPRALPTCLLFAVGTILGCPSPASMATDTSTDTDTSTGTDGTSTGTDGTDTSTGTGGTDIGETDSGTFVPDPDTGGLESCEPGQQDCPEGEKCVWYAPEPGWQRRDAARCIPVTGDIAPFEPCSLPTGIGPEVSDDCGPESFCLEVYGTADHGFCAPFADYDQPQFCDHLPGTQYATENGSTFPDACLHYECQPLLPDTCPADMRCDFYPAFLYGTNMCWKIPASEDLPLGAACDFGQCGPGELCAFAEWLPDCASERCCAQWCDLGNPSCAAAGTECEFFPAWGGVDDPDYQWLGACVLGGAFE